MNEFFARLYEWFGMRLFYSKDLGAHLRGLDFACTGFFAVPWYIYIGLLMFVLTLIIYGLQNNIVSSSRFEHRTHWWLVALTIVLVNFVIAFTIPCVALQTGTYCHQLKLSFFDCTGFGVSNAIWSFILYLILSGLHFIRNSVINKKKFI